MSDILFVCTGNTCRSAMAQGFCQAQLAEKLSCKVDQLEKKGYKVMSAGVMGFDGASASPEAIQAAREAGADISKHKSRPLSANLIKQADYIFAMDNSHCRSAINLVPEAKTRIVLLTENCEIDDPISGSIEVYRSSATRIEQGVKERLEKGFTAPTE